MSKRHLADSGKIAECLFNFRNTESARTNFRSFCLQLVAVLFNYNCFSIFGYQVMPTITSLFVIEYFSVCKMVGVAGLIQNAFIDPYIAFLLFLLQVYGQNTGISVIIPLS